MSEPMSFPQFIVSTLLGLGVFYYTVGQVSKLDPDAGYGQLLISIEEQLVYETLKTNPVWMRKYHAFEQHINTLIGSGLFEHHHDQIYTFRVSGEWKPYYSCIPLILKEKFKMRIVWTRFYIDNTGEALYHFTPPKHRFYVKFEKEEKAPAATEDTDQKVPWAVPVAPPAAEHWNQVAATEL